MRKTIHFGFLLTFLTGFVFLGTAQTLKKEVRPDGPVFILTGDDGSTKVLKAAADDDGDGIETAMELNGFTYDIINGLQAWNGDTTVEYYKTDPTRWSTDGDPYSDFMEVSGINMPSAIAAPENHPLVAARPIISIKMDDYDVIPIADITDTKGGSQESSFTNETSTSNTVSAEVTVEAELNPFKLVGGSVTAGYSHTWSSTQSSTSSFGSNWSNTRSTNPSEAGRLRLRIYMENEGGATALDVQPTINLKLGKKVIATFIPSQIANTLTPPGTSNSRFPQNDNIVIEKDNNNNDLIISLDDLKAIQAGTPLSLEVVQVSAKVQRWNDDDKQWNSDIDWAGFESDIDPVSVNVRAELGDGENYRYQVFAGSQYWDPQLTLKDVASLIFNVNEAAGVDYIEGREYPEKWYLSTPSQEIITAWNDLGQPQNMFNVPITKNTKLVMISPGSSPSSIVNMATYTGDYKKVIVSAIPNNFPILSVKADIPVNGEIQTITLKQNNTSFFVNDTLIEGIPDGPGTVYVTNARGDVTTTTVQLPSFYSSAQDVKDYSPIIPIPGGEYWIYPEADADPLLIYCLFYDPDTEEELPVSREYLSINNEAVANTFSEVAYFSPAGKAYFEKLRMNPKTLKIALDDQTFMNIESAPNANYIDEFKIGNLYYSYPDIDSLQASMDLSGTPFSFDPSVTISRSEADAFVSKNRKKFIIKKKGLLDLGSICCTHEGFVGDSLQLVYNYQGVKIAQNPMSDNMAIHLNATGSDGYVNAGDSDSLRVEGNFTVEVWIYPTGPGIDDPWGGMIVNKEGEFEIFRNQKGVILWAITNTSPGWFWQSSFYKAPENEWLHIGFVYNQSEVKIYFNGILFYSAPATGTVGDFYAGLNDLWISGRQANANQRFQGLIDEVRVWNVARTEQQIKSNYLSKLAEQYYTSSDSGLIGYWNLDEIVQLNDSTRIVKDLSVYGNDGTLFGDVTASEILTDLQVLPAQKTPQSYSLNQNYPNPFNPQTIIKYGLKKAAHVKLEIYNIMGKKVKTLISDFENAGSKTIQWNGQNELNQSVASGTYIYAMFINGTFVASKKMVLIR